MSVKIKKEIKGLVIVESPSKAKTIQKYLGKDYIVKASVGHIKDLPKSTLGVNIEKNFEAEYHIIPNKVKVIQELKEAAKHTSLLYLATDPDREGEAIAWHIQEELKARNKQFNRVLFNAITKTSVLEAMAKPGSLNADKYYAQQARRILDRLVGYKISPLLWEKVRRGISAGRVQSVALRMIVERQKEIEAFKAQEYWMIEAHFQSGTDSVKSKLVKIDEKDPELHTEEQATEFVNILKASECRFVKLEKKERQRKPQPPFITSRLQQDSANKLGFSAKKTMMIAQKLYEGMPLGEYGTHGLITYMRTDSVRTEPAAVENARQWIKKNYGEAFLPPVFNEFKSKKNIQDAHEAIRPASLEYPPEKIKSYLDNDTFMLYQLIWNRFIASQMRPAIYHQTILEIQTLHEKHGGLFRSTASVLHFPGYTKVYEESLEENQPTVLSFPNWSHETALQIHTIQPSQHFTAPPARFSDASLIKELEEKGIGRPSTYAAILSNLQDREYVEKRENRYYPSELGQIVTDLLIHSFPDILNTEFTANMESQLDAIEAGTLRWTKSLKTFWKSFEESLENAKKEMKNLKAQVIPTSFICHLCGKFLVIKWGKMGSFLACNGYPECTNTQDFKKNEKGEIEIIPKEFSDKKCPKCNTAMVVKNGKFGKFLACNNYPTCKHTQPFSIGIACPSCKAGEIVQKQSIRFKKIFYSCNQYPQCTFASWDEPIQKECPQCHSSILVKKTTKKQGHFFKCIQKNCSFWDPIPEIGKNSL